MKKRKLPRIVVLAIFSLATALVWAFSDILRSLTKPQEIEVAEGVLEPLDPTLNSDAITKMQNSIFFEEGQVSENIVQPSPSPEAISEPEFETEESESLGEESPLPSSTPEEIAL